jgi:hypothetical protein
MCIKEYVAEMCNTDLPRLWMALSRTFCKLENRQLFIGQHKSYRNHRKLLKLHHATKDPGVTPPPLLGPSDLTADTSG